MPNTRKSRLLHSCRLGLSAMALAQFAASPVLAAEWPIGGCGSSLLHAERLTLSVLQRRTAAMRRR